MILQYDYNAFKAYLPTMLDTADVFIKDVSFLYFYQSDADSLAVLKVFPNSESPTVIMAYKTVSSKNFDNHINRAYSLAKKYIKSCNLTIPPEGLAWLIDLEGGDLVYFFNKEEICNYSDWEWCPPEEDIKVKSVLIFSEKSTEKTELFKVSTRTTAVDVALWLYIETKELTKKQYKTLFGRKLISRLLTTYYRIPEPVEHHLDWCINPESDPVIYKMEQTKSLLACMYENNKPSAEGDTVILWEQIEATGLPKNLAGWCKPPEGVLSGVESFYAFYGKVYLIPINPAILNFGEIADVLGISQQNIAIQSGLGLPTLGDD